MIDRLLAFVSALPGGTDTKRDRSDDPRVAAAALMFHVIEADGVRRDQERERLKEALGQAYSLDGRELDDLVEAGQAAEQEAVDLYAFTSVLKRHLDEEARVTFIGLLWEVVYSDGERHELEDNVVWRVAELIGVSSRDRVLMRQKARADSGVEDGTED